MADPVYLTINEFPGTGAPAPTVVDFNFAGGYISPAHVKAEVFDPATYLRTSVAVTDDNFVSAFRLSLPVSVPTGSVLRVYRDTPKEQPLVDFTNGARIAESNLDLVAQQAVFVAAESADQIAATQIADVLQAVEAAATAAAAAEATAAGAAISASASEVQAAAAAAAATLEADRALGVRADLADAAQGASMVATQQTGAFAVARTVAAKLQEIAVSVTDFGADPTGTTSSATAFQRARDAVLAKMLERGATGGVIHVPAGCKFRLDSVTRLDPEHSGIEIHAHGATMFKGVDSGASMFRFYGDRNKILGGTIDGNTAAGYTDSSMVLIYGDESVIRGVTFKNASKNGLAYSQETPGDYASAPRNGEVSGCWFFDNDGVGLSVASARGLRIIGNHIERSGFEGLTLDQGAEFITVSGNYFNNNNLGRRGANYGLGGGIGSIGYDDGINLTIQGNTFLNGLNRPAIRQGNALGDTIGLLIQGNTFQNFVTGIDLLGTAASTQWDKEGIITGNTFRGVTNAILYDGNVRGIHIGPNTYNTARQPVGSTASYAGPPGTNTPIVVVASGQSNVLGFNTGGTFAVDPDVKLWDHAGNQFRTADLQTDAYTTVSNIIIGDRNNDNNGYNNWVVAFAHRLKAETGRPVFVIIEGSGGRPISEWVGSGVSSIRYAELRTAVSAALPGTGRTAIDFFLWSQGERDEDDGVTSADYTTALNTLIAQVRAESWASSTTPFITTQLLQADYPTTDAVQIALTALNADSASAETACASSDGLTGSAKHFDGASLWHLGYNRAWLAYRQEFGSVTNVNVADLSPGQVKWAYRKGANALNMTGNGTLARVVYETSGNMYSRIPVTHDAFVGGAVVPVSAHYSLTASVEISGTTGATSGVIEIQSNGVAISRRKFDFDGTLGDITMQITASCEFLTAGSVITVHASLTGIGADTADFVARPLGSEFFGVNV